MKKIVLSCFMIVLIASTCTQKEGKFPQGAWQLVSVKSFSGDTLVQEYPLSFTGSDIVIFSEHHFNSIGRFQIDTTFINNAVGATYSLEGNRCEETLLYFPDQSQVGQMVKSILEVRIDTLIKTYPYDDSWKLGSKYSVEKYIQIE